jgi:hypothetical protein
VLGLGGWWRAQALVSVCRARRAAKEAKEAPAQPAPEKVKVEVKKFVKIGRPGYKGVCVCVCDGLPMAGGYGMNEPWPWHRTYPCP